MPMSPAPYLICKPKQTLIDLKREAKMSYLNLIDSTQTGFSSRLELGKVFGNYQYSIRHTYADDKYDINDLGLIFRNNYNNLRARVSYEIFEPTENFQNFRLRFFRKL